MSKEEVLTEMTNLEMLKIQYESRLNDLVFYKEECLNTSKLKLSNQVYSEINDIMNIINNIDKKQIELENEYQLVTGKKYEKIKPKILVKTLFKPKSYS